MSKTYVCGACGNTYEEAWSDEKAKAELAKTFPNVEVEDCDLVCDDCFNKWFKPLTENTVDQR